MKRIIKQNLTLGVLLLVFGGTSAVAQTSESAPKPASDMNTITRNAGIPKTSASGEKTIVSAANELTRVQPRGSDAQNEQQQAADTPSSSKRLERRTKAK